MINRIRATIFILSNALILNGIPIVHAQTPAPPGPAVAESAADIENARSRTLAVVQLFDGVADEALVRGVVSRMRLQFKSAIGDRFKIFNEKAVEEFTIPTAVGGNFFQPVQYADAISREQKQFLETLTKDNSVDVIVLGSLLPVSSGVQLNGQLFDRQHSVFTRVESVELRSGTSETSAAVALLVGKLAAYIDPDGWVNTAPVFAQPTEESIASIISEPSVGASDPARSVKPIDYRQFDTAGLRGPVNFSGEERRFWEQWWFWTIIGTVGAVGLGAGLYVVTKPEPNNDVLLDVTFTAGSGSSAAR